MTFSQEVKSEILKKLHKVKDCCAQSFLVAVIKSIGSLELSFGGGFCFTIESDNHDLLLFCKNIAKEKLSVASEIQATNANAKGLAVYSCSFANNIGQKINLIKRDSDGMLSINQDVYSLLPQNECCKKAFMQGLILACGSVAIPVLDSDVGENKSGSKYHLELRFSDEDFVKAVAQSYDFPFRVLARKNGMVLYLKDSEVISDLLVYVEAISAKMKLENVIIGRSLRNTANRQSNCISANIDKSVNASEKQLENILIIRKHGKFETLAEPLKEIATKREENPEATLEEIAKMVGVSKSGANHRFTKIAETAEGLEKDNI